MSRTQVTLDPDALLRARRRARNFGISVGEYITRLIAGDVDRSAVFDLGSSQVSDVRNKKDAMVGEAFASRR